MARLQSNKPPQDPRRVFYAPRKRRQRKTPRWELLIVPLILIFAGWFLSQVVVDFSFDDIADAFGVCGDRERFRELMMLGLLCVGAAIAARCWKDSRKG